MDQKVIKNFESAARRLNWMDAIVISYKDNCVELKIGTRTNLVLCDTLQEATDFTTLINLLKDFIERWEDIEPADIPIRYENEVYKLNVEVPVIDGVVQCVEVNGQVLDDGDLADMFIELATE